MKYKPLEIVVVTSLLLFCLAEAVIINNLYREKTALLTELEYFHSLPDDWPEAPEDVWNVPPEEDWDPIPGEGNIEGMALQLLFLMGTNTTTLYTEQIGNTTITVKKASVSGSAGEGWIYTFGYGNPIDGTMHMEFYLSDGRRFMKFIEIELQPGDGYAEMYTEDGRFFRREYP